MPKIKANYCVVHYFRQNMPLLAEFAHHIKHEAKVSIPYGWV